MPLLIGGRTVHQIGLPYHWGVGASALVTGDSANDLFGVTLDPNVQIQESKVASCDIRPGRRPTGPALLRLVAGLPAAGRHHRRRPATSERHPGDRPPAARRRSDE